MSYKKVDAADLAHFKTIVGAEFVFTDDANIEKFSRDETDGVKFPPEVVIKPITAQEISAILKYCNQHRIPVSPRAAGTGLSANSLCVHGGVMLSIERMNKILKIDERSLQVTTEPAVITEALQNTLQEKGLFYPVDPSSRGTSFIGGNVACNSGGPRAVKYGVVKDFVLNLEVVLPNGEIMWTGANTLKNSTGYNLTQLIVGSEGTLAVVTKIVLKLLPYPKFNNVMLAPFKSMDDASAAVSAVFRAGIIPSCIEFMERDAVEYVMNFLGDVSIPLADDTQATLLIEVDGNDMETIQKDCEKIYDVLSQFEVGDILFADSEAQKIDLWRMRRNIAYAVKKTNMTVEEDTVVPRAELPELLKHIKEVGKKWNFRSVCYGHAGDGNVHVRILKDELTDDYWKNEVPKGIREIFEKVVELGGTISGEHGIGWIQIPYMDIKFKEVQLQLMRNIKQVFDPNNILNPGKIF
ncbi:MAG TPA: FAD-linked oxidase C-terminal domain-containing protein [Chitinophagales bacterium]|nr:FAD-linked oxidase C-terminal domain-containing protein [Chitinophagales bacterium]